MEALGGAAAVRTSCIAPCAPSTTSRVGLIRYGRSRRVSVGLRVVRASSVEQAELPSKLKSIVDLFSGVCNPRDKYEQLMHYARRLKPLAEEHHCAENKVQGCVSQVWVRAYLDSQAKVQFEADSDSILTKGLAALLVEGLSGSSLEEIVGLSPSFIQMLGLQQSLTASRSNGFFNMFRMMQKKALQLHMVVGTEGGGPSASPPPPPPPVPSVAGYDAEKPEAPAAPSTSSSRRADIIEKKLREALRPSLLEVDDVSHQHAGHAAVRGTAGETHFNVKVVSDQFEGRSLVKRHRLVYDLLDEELKAGLHALSIVAKTPAEVSK